MQQWNELCPGCFAVKGLKQICPYCGYDETQPRLPIALAHRSLLREEFLVGRVLGKPGGYGITYLGWDTTLLTRVAIKEFFPTQLVSREPESSAVIPHSKEDGMLFGHGLDDFLEEARSLVKFDHRNLVKVRQFFQGNDTAYLLMKYYEGVTLQEYLIQKGGKLVETEAVDIIMQILDGLEEVHSKGMLHRDIKPQNIYLTKEGFAILLDFGAARHGLGKKTQSLSVILTPGFAPYEQYHRHGNQGPWTDIYACAATLFKMVTGDTPPAAIERIEHDPFPLDNKAFHRLSHGLKSSLLEGLAVQPEDRIGSVGVFRQLMHRPEPMNFRDWLPTITWKSKATMTSGRSTKTTLLRKWMWRLMGIAILTVFVSWLSFTLGKDVFQDATDAYNEGNFAEAARLYRQVADQGNIQAQYILGKMYAEGGELPHNHEEAALWFRRAANQGNAQAQYSLGNLYYSGEGVLKSYRDAVTWYRKAAEQGHSEAQYSLGNMYFFGHGVPHSHEEAAPWFRRAADQGNARAQYSLGNLYYSGEGVSKSYRDAVTWYRKAAEQGHSEAQYSLGNMYFFGHGVPHSHEEATPWFRRAADQGNKKAEEMVSK